MIVGAYTLDLYCDKVSKKHEYGEFPHQFVGHSREYTFRLARMDGWRLNYVKSIAICPKCSRKVKK